jgi:2-(1,2-epoxy-1,2-dihydrophenyl)acetyl-CoA isomerase
MASLILGTGFIWGMSEIGFAAGARCLLGGNIGRIATKMAYPPDAGGSWLLPRLIGLAAARRFVYTGEFWSAAEAMAAGLVSEIHPAESLRGATIDFALRLAAGPTVAIGEAKRLMQSAAMRDLPAQLAAEHAAGLRCGRTKDAHEALVAAVARREPVFRGD